MIVKRFTRKILKPLRFFKRSSAAQRLPPEIVDEIFAHIGAQLTHALALSFFLSTLEELPDVISVVSTVRKTQYALAIATSISRRWHASGIRILYARPFLIGRTRVAYFSRSICSRPDLARLVRVPGLMFIAPVLFPPPPAPRLAHWWQRHRAIAFEESLEGFARAISACPALEGAVYFSRQRETGYNFPRLCLQGACAPRILTLTGCGMEAYGFPSDLVLAKVEELCLAGIGLATTLPALPALRILRLIRLHLQEGFTGSLLAPGDRPPLKQVELLGNTSAFLTAVASPLVLHVGLVRLVLGGRHEAALLPDVLVTGRSLHTLSHLTVFSSGFTGRSAGTYLPRSLHTLEVVRAFSPGDYNGLPDDLSAFAVCLEGSACRALVELSIVGVVGAPGIEEADIISLGRIERWCTRKAVPLKLDREKCDEFDYCDWLSGYARDSFYKTL